MTTTLSATTDTNSSPASTLIETDARSRVTLPGSRSNRRYLVREEPDGTLILEPAVVLSELELRYLSSSVAAKVEDARAHPERAKGRPARRTPARAARPTR